MDLEKIKEIIQLMNDEDLLEVEIEEEGKRVKLKKRQENIITEIAPRFAPTAVSLESKESGVDDGCVYINAPMVGTFYKASAPDSDSFVEVGDVIVQGKTVCIIEAMKLMNEIKSEVKGKIVEILVENGDPVDFGQPIFKIASKA
ncbi:MAG: acetyl-CoA carboxylase biotin carboxyl carrier protein [Candidatus Saelkia tenebricola]|nr:acetyl-CoA carboxylase biotin carboxyl carrier protein [Candidatus Saelkia tenebricola]